MYFISETFYIINYIIIINNQAKIQCNVFEVDILKYKMFKMLLIFLKIFKKKQNFV